MLSHHRFEGRPVHDKATISSRAYGCPHGHHRLTKQPISPLTATSAAQVFPRASIANIDRLKLCPGSDNAPPCAKPELVLMNKLNPGRGACPMSLNRNSVRIRNVVEDREVARSVGARSA